MRKKGGREGTRERERDTMPLVPWRRLPLVPWHKVPLVPWRQLPMAFRALMVSWRKLPVLYVQLKILGTKRAHVADLATSYPNTTGCL